MDASSVGFKQPVLLRLARQRLDDEFDHAGVAAVRDTITSINLLACLVPQRDGSLSVRVNPSPPDVGGARA